MKAIQRIIFVLSLLFTTSVFVAACGDAHQVKPGCCEGECGCEECACGPCHPDKKEA